MLEEMVLAFQPACCLPRGTDNGEPKCQQAGETKGEHEQHEYTAPMAIAFALFLTGCNVLLTSNIVKNFYRTWVLGLRS